MERRLRGVSDIDDFGVEIYETSSILPDKIVESDDADFSECPKCGSNDIQYDVNGIEPEALFVYRIHSCSKCGIQWEERYDLVQVRINQ